MIPKATIKAQKQGFNPQVINNPICHHYRFFSLDINEYEKLKETAQVMMGKLWMQIQSSTI